MRDHEGPDGGQLREGMRPGGDVKAGALEPRAQVHQHVMASMMAKSHEEGAKKDPPPGAPLQARRQTVGRVPQHVTAADGAQLRLQPGEGGLAFGAAMARQRHDAPGLRGQHGIERAGNDSQVLGAREQGRGKPKLVKGGRGITQRTRRRALQATVGHVRGHHERPPHPSLAQIRQHLGQQGAHRSPARAGAQDNVGTDRVRQRINQGSNALVPTLSGKAPSYDKRIT